MIIFFETLIKSNSMLTGVGTTRIISVTHPRLSYLVPDAPHDFTHWGRLGLDFNKQVEAWIQVCSNSSSIGFESTGNFQWTYFLCRFHCSTSQHHRVIFQPSCTSGNIIVVPMKGIWDRRLWTCAWATPFKITQNKNMCWSWNVSFATWSIFFCNRPVKI